MIETGVNQVSWLKIFFFVITFHILLFLCIGRYITWDIFLKEKPKFWTKGKIVFIVLFGPFIGFVAQIGHFSPDEILYFSLLFAVIGMIEGIVIRSIRWKKRKPHKNKRGHY